MSDAPHAVSTHSQADLDERGWYLYGITRRTDTTVPPRAESPIKLLACGDLAAVVRQVPLADFTPEAIEARVQDMDALEALVREHNRVIEEVHRQEAILPAKFGSVYARREDIEAALDASHDHLLRRLCQVEGCDEWSIHLYADRSTIEQHVASEHPAIKELRREISSARPGRAYFLERKLAGEITAATMEELGAIAARVYEDLANLSAADQIGQTGQSPLAQGEEIETLRASFLVQRENEAAFLQYLRSLSDSEAGVRAEYSGPWPPYSFAVISEDLP